MLLSIIVAVSENQVIGSDNQLSWHLPVDLQYFKSITTGHPIIMGRKTYESIGKPLPRRVNIVITRDAGYKAEGVQIVHSLDEAVTFCRQSAFDDVFIIGGDSIYQQALHLADKIYLTRVHAVIHHGDAFFPDLSDREWHLVSSAPLPADEKNEFACTFEVYEKRTVDS